MHILKVRGCPLNSCGYLRLRPADVNKVSVLHFLLGMFHSSDSNALAKRLVLLCHVKFIEAHFRAF